MHARDKPSFLFEISISIYIESLRIWFKYMYVCINLCKCKRLFYRQKYKIVRVTATEHQAFASLDFNVHKTWLRQQHHYLTKMVQIYQTAHCEWFPNTFSIFRLWKVIVEHSHIINTSKVDCTLGYLLNKSKNSRRHWKLFYGPRLFRAVSQLLTSEIPKNIQSSLIYHSSTGLRNSG